MIVVGTYVCLGKIASNCHCSWIVRYSTSHVISFCFVLFLSDPKCNSSLITLFFVFQSIFLASVCCIFNFCVKNSSSLSFSLQHSGHDQILKRIRDIILVFQFCLVAHSFATIGCTGSTVIYTCHN